MAEWEAHIRHSNTFLVPALLSPSGKAAALIIEFDGDTDNAAEIVALVNRLRDELEPFQGVEGLHYTVAGVPAVRRDFLPLVFWRYPILRWDRAFPRHRAAFPDFFRNWSGVLIPLLAAGVPVLFVFGLMGWPVNPSTFSIVLHPLPAIAIADAIHVLSRYREERARGWAAMKPLSNPSVTWAGPVC